MSSRLVEPSRTLEVLATYDVVVVGGGIAGVAAALAASRNGARTCVLERQFGLGGLATLGNVIVYLPLCDGRGHQVIGGIAEELLLRSVADLRGKHDGLGLEPVPTCWQPGGSEADRAARRYDARFNPFALQLELEALLAEAGVELWYDTRLCAVAHEAGRLTHLIVENKDGRVAVGCGCVVDATGDADVCALAGEATESLDSNVLAGWYYLLRDGALSLRVHSRRYSPTAGRDDADGPFFRGDRARDVTDQLLETRAWLRDDLADERRRHPEAEIQPFALASIPSFRMTRRLVSSYSLRAEHDHVWHADAIGLTGDWRAAGPVWSMPYRSIRAEQTANLLVAGRCISADASVWDVTRAIPTCAMTGQAAGTAAAMAAGEGSSVQELVVGRLQERLLADGVILDRRLLSTLGESSC